MGWLPQVMAVLAVIERVIPLVERLLPQGSGRNKSAIVHGNAVAVAASTLGVETAADPEVAAAIQRKIDADVQLANLLQQKGVPRDIPRPTTSVPLTPPPATP